MILERGVPVGDLVLVRRPKLCTAVLKVNDKVRLNSGGAAVRVIIINGDRVTVETQDLQGRPEAITFPRACWQKARVWNWLSWKFRAFMSNWAVRP